ncbi:LysM peptidoglycan-binding domain-containing protein [Lihuaxuella thermophila]|uniref:3D (Asp-Asp-Asp) domain-containing protein n=1 Tax=Lihuaxuella thermophila TaxID=1173111 RepID=A0A1H8J0D5_9BACL|nr:LysM peptidoglycan-binding domain-containing protein [Lihuaxuella thermophila]SEN73627.1 3D (Asp-Asp-Asp) domain-containing protein [Lihuaxuella thermophila]
MKIKLRHLILAAAVVFVAGFQQAKSLHPTVEAKESEYRTVTVKKGDTVYRIARKYGTTVKSIAKLNGLNNPSLIRAGQVLRLPLPAFAEHLHQKERGSGLTDAVPVSMAMPVMSRGRSLGEFTLTAYTSGPESTGKRPGDAGYGITSSGGKAVEGVTIAVDPAVISLGSRVYIEGIGYRVAQDIGSAIKGKKIDLYMDDVTEARKFGVKKNIKVEIVD